MYALIPLYLQKYDTYEWSCQDKHDWKQLPGLLNGSLNVPIEHHPTIRYMVYNGYYKVMSNSPKNGHLPTPVDVKLQIDTCRIKRNTRSRWAALHSLANATGLVCTDAFDLSHPRPLVTKKSLSYAGGVASICLYGSCFTDFTWDTLSSLSFIDRHSGMPSSLPNLVSDPKWYHYMPLPAARHSFRFELSLVVQISQHATLVTSSIDNLDTFFRVHGDQELQLTHDWWFILKLSV